MDRDMADMPIERYAVGQKVKAKIQLINDLRDDGMGVILCAEQNEVCVINKVKEEWYTVHTEKDKKYLFNALHSELSALEDKP